jgi:Fe-S oxidoreductase
MAPERRVPRFAAETFRRRVTGRKTPGGGEPVLLWPDTFTNYLQPDVAMAAVGVLESLDCRVTIPPTTLCCGRPLYDYGFLDTAKRQLRRILAALARDLRDGVPVVVLEPSCASVFRDELLGLLPDEPDARRLASQTFLLGEFVDARRARLRTDGRRRRALVQAHCHHRAVMHTDPDVRVLSEAGIDAELLDAGCCGMAGAFGFETDHYPVSIACGERALLPAVRAGPARHADRRRWLQLSGADRAHDRAPRASPRRSPAVDQWRRVMTAHVACRPASHR